jgi:hypothetical protein
MRAATISTRPSAPLPLSTLVLRLSSTLPRSRLVWQHQGRLRTVSGRVQTPMKTPTPTSTTGRRLPRLLRVCAGGH